MDYQDYAIKTCCFFFFLICENMISYSVSLLISSVDLIYLPKLWECASAKIINVFSYDLFAETGFIGDMGHIAAIHHNIDKRKSGRRTLSRAVAIA